MKTGVGINVQIYDFFWFYAPKPAIFCLLTAGKTLKIADGVKFLAFCENLTNFVIIYKERLVPHTDYPHNQTNT